MGRHLFLTGLRGVGKSTLLNQILSDFSRKIGGFQTVWNNDQLYLLPYGATDFPLDNRVAGRFDLARWRNSKAFDHVGETLFVGGHDVIVMDELGFFEGDSPVFQEKILECLDGETPVIGVIKPQHTDFLDKIRSHPQVDILWVTEANRNRLREERTWESYTNGSQI